MQESEFSLKRVDILGYEIVSDSLESCMFDITTCLKGEDRSCRWVACMNPHSYVVARTDRKFRDAVRLADWVVPDGVGILIAGRILGHSPPNRITGFDVFEGVMRELNKSAGSVFFLGSTQATLDDIARKLKLDYPLVRLVGTLSPPFLPSLSDEQNARILTQIAHARPDVLWVGMTAPKQEKWIAELQSQLPVKFAGTIGAVFDFYAGKIKRSNPFFQRMGLEWLPRLVQEPRRLWRRVVVSAPIFIWDVLKARIKSN